MKNVPRLSRMSYLHFTSLLLASFFATTTLACDDAQWQVGGIASADGLVEANDPNNGVARVFGECGLEATGTGSVHDDSPFEDAKFIGHFYFLPQITGGTGEVDLFIAYSTDAANPADELFSVKFDGANVIFDTTGANPAIVGTSVTVPADPTHWNLVEFEWTSGQTGNIWVNSDSLNDAADETFTSGIGAVESIKLGLPNGLNFPTEHLVVTPSLECLKLLMPRALQNV